MHLYSNSSEAKLMTCRAALQDVFLAVLKEFDHTITCGYRGKIEQNKFYDAGQSEVKYPHSKHNKIPSEAVDAYPYPVDFEDTERMVLFAGMVIGIAQRMGVKIRWGGDWDSDTEVQDESFRDLCHFELVNDNA